jgi:hypothetical protein
MEIAKIVNQRYGAIRRGAKEANETAHAALEKVSGLEGQLNDLTRKVEELGARPTFDPEAFRQGVLGVLQRELEMGDE